MRGNPSLKMLREAGLPVDWMTVYVGWRGLAGLYGARRLPSNEVIDFAYDCLGISPPDQADAVFRIADAEPRYTGLNRERRFLDELARQSGVSEQTALRTWRLADAVEVQKTVAYWLRGEGLRDRDHALYAAKTLYYFDSFWREGSEYPPLPDFDFIGVLSAVEQTSRRFDDWIAVEKAALTSPKSAATDGW